MASSNFEKYLAGEPLNEELAAIRAGQLPDFGIHTQQPFAAAPEQPLEDDEKPLTRDECIALREMRLSSGWPVMQKILRRATMAHKKAAVMLSEQDPFGKDQANAWLEVKIWKQVTAQFDWLTVIAIQSLEEADNEAKSTL